ncbi:MAG TPA: phosphatidylserine/phosphatidylglycerophosphate/cardiolipin synthase family protein [Patescibacteria group bacterium]
MTLAERLSVIDPLPNYSIINAQQFYPRLIEEINSAESRVDLNFFIVQKDHHTKPFFEALENAAKRGVQVRLSYEKFFSSNLRAVIPTYFAFRRYARKVHGTSIETQRARQKSETINPLRKNHKKFVVIDPGTENARAYVGGTNMAGHYYNWRDSMTYVTGDISEALAKDFEKTWNSTNLRADRYLVGNPKDATEILTDSKSTSQNIERLVQEMDTANRTILIETSYLRGHKLLDAMRRAKKRNPDIDIKLLVPHPSVSNDILFRLFPNFWLNPFAMTGADVYLYGKADNQFSHAKTIVVDDLAIVGSSNFVNSTLIGGNAELIMISKNPYLNSQARDWILGGIKKSEKYLPKKRNKNYVIRALS